MFREPSECTSKSLLILRASVVVLLLFFQQHPAVAQRSPNPAMQPIEDKVGLPRVLLIGDSISIGYTVPVRTLLKDEANVHRPLTNCASSRKGIAKIKEWLGDKNWDVIHFNFGLHDLKHIIEGSEQLVGVDKNGAQRQVSKNEYRKNLSTIVSELKKSGAKLVWCNTTPVPVGATGRIPEDVAAYNEVAHGVMKDADIAIHDLNKHALSKIKEVQKPRNVHFSAEGSKFLAKSVAATIREQLDR